MTVQSYNQGFNIQRESFHKRRKRYDWLLERQFTQNKDKLCKQRKSKYMKQVKFGEFSMYFSILNK